MGMNKDNVDDIFTYHAPDEQQVEALKNVRLAAKNLAKVMLECVPVCADQQAALRLLRESVMTANAAIVLKGMV
jgi:tryptophanyl-tRNA synthetase